jgi:hypothetical protein
VRALLPEGAAIAVLEEGPGAAIASEQGWLALNGSAPDGTSPLAALDSARRQGARFLVVPRPAFTWLSSQPELEAALRRDHRLVTRQENLGEIYELVR